MTGLAAADGPAPAHNPAPADDPARADGPAPGDNPAAAFDAEQRRTWARQAEDYARTFALLCAGPVPDVLDAIGAGPGLRILDAGTGPGTLAAACLARGATATAFDADPTMAALARTAAPDAGVLVAAIPDLPFGDSRFDACAANFLLDHVGAPGAALTELARVTKPGGRIAVTAWSAVPPMATALFGLALKGAGAVRPPARRGRPTRHDFEHTEAGLATLMRDSGLDGVECRAVAWTLVVERDVWWSGPVSGVAGAGYFHTSQTPEVRAEAERRFTRLAAVFEREDGLLALPAAALLGVGTVPGADRG
ncbi:SAM-dependent methyltransferase [Catenulispora sp. GP43]|uniref:class I SAM-dependent methyltransferase n=1 Tax=Catenulispora sp. GP43 TaxID=3156263 RepID=UPI0035162FC0